MPTDRSPATETRDLFQNPATEVSSLRPELNYRGYPVDQLADQANYVDVAWLLLHGDLPTQEQLADFQSLIVEQAVPEDDLLARLELLPLHVPGSEVLQTAVSMLSLDDSESRTYPGDDRPDSPAASFSVAGHCRLPPAGPARRGLADAPR